MPAVSATDICDGLAVTAQQCPRMLDERDLPSRVRNQISVRKPPPCSVRPSSRPLLKHGALDQFFLEQTLPCQILDNGFLPRASHSEEPIQDRMPVGDVLLNQRHLHPRQWKDVKPSFSHRSQGPLEE